MSWGISAAAAIVGGAVVGAVGSNMAAGKAADAQKDAARTASNTEMEMYWQNREDMLPWVENGRNALNRLTTEALEGGPGNFKESPGYQFAFNEGLQAIDRSAAARGRLNSGAQDKALTRYGQGIANQEYDNFLARYYNSLRPLQSVAGIGHTSANTMATMGTNVAGSVAQTQLSAGDARASGYINQGNVMSNLANQAGQGMAWYAGQNQFPAFNSPASAQTGNYGPVQGG